MNPIATAPAPQEPTPGAPPQAPAATAPATPAPDAAVDGPRARPQGSLFFVALAVGALFLLTGRSKAERMPTFTLSPAETGKGADCLTKPKCVFVYVAPWCPACHATRPTIQALATEWKSASDIGITVVVGKDEPAKLRETAAQFEQGAFLDLDGSFHKSAKVEGVPYWLVVESSKITKRMAGGFPNVASARHYLGLDAK